MSDLLWFTVTQLYKSPAEDFPHLQVARPAINRKQASCPLKLCLKNLSTPVHSSCLPLPRYSGKPCFVVFLIPPLPTRVFMSPMWTGLVAASKSMCQRRPSRQHVCGPEAWPEWRELSFLRMESGEACSTQRGSGRRTKTSSHPYPPPPVRPCPCPFPRSRRLFSGRPGFLCDGVVEERRKRGGWERKRQTDGEVDRDEVMAQCS